MKRERQKPARAPTKRRAARELPAAKHDWREFDARTDADILRAAQNDPDAQPLTDAQLRRMKRPNPKVVRQALGLSQEEFAERFRIPIGTLGIGSRGVSSRIRLRAPI
jgi:hypothetical protein